MGSARASEVSYWFCLELFFIRTFINQSLLYSEALNPIGSYFDKDELRCGCLLKKLSNTLSYLFSGFFRENFYWYADYFAIL